MKRLGLIFFCFALSLFICIEKANAEIISYEQLIYSNENVWIVNSGSREYHTHFISPSKSFNSIEIKVRYAGTSTYFKIFAGSAYSKCTELPNGTNTVILEWAETDLVLNNGQYFQGVQMWDNSTCTEYSSDQYPDLFLLGKDETCSGVDGCLYHYSGGFSENFKPYFRIGTNIPIGNLTIDTPLNQSTVNSNEAMVFSGLCPINGINQLGLINYYEEGVISGVVFNDPVFDISCIDHEWSTSISAEDYLNVNLYSIYDKTNWINHITSSNNEPPKPNNISAHVNIIITDQNSNWNLSLLFPSCEDGWNCNKLKSGNWRFKFAYSLPPGTPLETVVTNLMKYDYINSEWDTMFTTTLDLLDTKLDNTFVSDDDIEVVNEEKREYLIQFYIDDDLKLALPFQTFGDDEDGQNISDPTDQCGKYNFICLLLMPSQRVITVVITNIKLQMSDKIPFSYIVYFYDRVQNINLSDEDLELEIPLGASNGTVMTLPLNLSNTSISGITSPARPYLVMGTWLLFVAYMISKITGRKEE